MVNRIKELLRDEEGATMVEYALLLALISVAAITILGALGGNVSATFTKASDKMVTGVGN